MMLSSLVCATHVPFTSSIVLFLVVTPSSNLFVSKFTHDIFDQGDNSSVGASTSHFGIIYCIVGERSVGKVLIVLIRWEERKLKYPN